MKFANFLTLSLSALAALASPLPEAEAELEARQTGCSRVYLYFARGTTEIGTLGTVVGPGLSAAVKTAIIGSVTVEGIAYPAVVSGYLAGGDRGGAKTMADKVAATAARCPNAKIFISGYSQGAQVTHLAARQLSSANQARVTGVITFGDPYERTSLPGGLQSRRLTYCAFGDLICDGLPTILPAHFTYGANVGTAAAWIAARA